MSDENRWATWRAPLAAAGVALLVYVVIPALAGPWGLVNYDDPYLVSATNPSIGQGLFSGLGELLNPFRDEQFMHAWLPLYYWSLGLDHALFGDSYLLWHAHSGVLHALCAALVVLIARGIGLRGAAPAAAGIVFAAHPIATESVAWIASRKDQLSFLWMAVATIAYLQGLRRRRPGWHALGALALAISMTAKGTTLVLPLLLVLHAWHLRQDRETPLRQRLAPIIPYAVVALLFTVLHLVVARREGTAGAGTGATIGELVVANLEVVWLYIRSFTLPWTGWLSVDHDVDPFAVDAMRAVLGGTLLCVWIAAAALAWRRRPPLAAALIAIALALAPFNNLLPRTSVLFAERYAYVALLPFALGVAVLVTARIGRLAPYLLAAALAVLAVPRLGVWHDSVSLWTNAARQRPASAVIQMQLADAYAASIERHPEEALARLQSAETSWRAARNQARDEIDRLRSTRGDVPFVWPLRQVQAETGLATQLLVTASVAADSTAQMREAIALFDSAEKLMEQLPNVAGRDERRYLLLSNRGAAREALGERDLALVDWRGAGLVDPTKAQPLNAMARIHLQEGRTQDAAKALEQSARVAPTEPIAARERSELRLAMGDAAGAKADLADALAEHADDVELIAAAGRLDMLLMRPVDAEARFRRALELRPGDAAIQAGLASALIQQAQAFAARDDVAGAQEAARKAAAVAPDSSAPEQILGIVARRSGDVDGAVLHFRRAYERHPEGVRIREALASVLVERAGELLDVERDALALIHLEEAVGVGPEVLATPSGRITTGVAGWPALTPDVDDRTLVARQSALRGLAQLAAGRPGDALVELQIAAAGTREGPPELRRVALELMVRAAFGAREVDMAVQTAGDLAGLSDAVDTYAQDQALRALASSWTEAGIAWRGRGRDTRAEDAFKKARATLVRAKEAGLDSAHLHQLTGEILFAEEDFLGATREFDRAAELAPENPEPLLDRAAVWRSQFLIHEDAAFLRGAEEDLRKAIVAAPSDSRVMAALGEVLLLSRKPSEAFPWLQRAVLADPSQIGARALLAELLVRAGRQHLEQHAETRDEARLDEAAAAAARALALDPPGPSALIFAGDVLRTEGDWLRALERFETAREQFPGKTEPLDALAGYYRDLGHAFLYKSDEKQAVEAFRRALEVEGATVDLTKVDERLRGIAMGAFKDGVIARREGRLVEAAAKFRVSVRAEPTAKGWFQLGAALGAAEDVESLDAAADAYAEALALDAALLAARLNRAEVLLRVGRPAAAADTYVRWLADAEADDPHRRAVERSLARAREIAASLEGLEDAE